MISLSHVSKQFGTTFAVKDVSLKAKEGEIIGFLGPNGAGKTTTMRMIMGYLTPTAGTVLVSGYRPLEERMSLLREVGYLPENNPLYTEMKVKEYLQLIKEIKEGKEDEVNSIVNNVGLSDVIHTKIEELSRGYKQRVGLAAALIGDPHVLILDEPTSGLDPLEQEKIKGLIKKISKQKTIIFSTHILSEVEDVATRLVIINQGRIVYDGTKPRGKGGVEKLFKKLVKS